MNASLRSVLCAGLLVSLPLAGGHAQEDDTYSEETILEAATAFFGESTEGLAKVVEKLFAEQGRPNAYVAGEEVAGAIGVGLRYGSGELHSKQMGGGMVYWTGPSVGFDLGGNASKVFVLVYDLPGRDALFQRFPAVDGSFYYVAGIGANYQRSDGITLAPIRLGVGLRAGASIGYMHYTRERTWVPF